MRFLSFKMHDRYGVGLVNDSGAASGCLEGDPDFPGTLDDLVGGGEEEVRAAAAVLSAGRPIDLSAVRWLPPLANPGKIICVGLNYADHSAESGYEQPDYPTIFGRFASSLIAHEDPIERPRLSSQLDFEGEIVAVIGKGGRHIPKDVALDHVLGYSLFNDGSIRDYQHRTPQWTMGKNFDGTGAFGPWLVTADELPAGCAGLRLETRLNGEVVQSASTDDLVFGIAELVSLLSEAFRLEPGDIIVSGTPAGVGAGRKPPLWMKPGDICEVSVDGLGVLRNTVVDEGATLAGGRSDVAHEASGKVMA